MSLINTINSIVAVDLDHMAPMPTVDAARHGGYCGPAVKPIALNMVAEIARDPETPNLPISGIGGISSWRDAAEFMVLGAGSVQVHRRDALRIPDRVGPPTDCRTGWTRRATRRSTTSAAARCRT